MPKQAQSQELLTIEDLLREQTFTNYDDGMYTSLIWPHLI